MKRILLLAAAAMAIAPVAWAADESDQVTATVGGTIPELCQMVLSGAGVAGLLTLTQDGSGETSYDQGYVESTNNATILTLDANKEWKLSVQYDTPWSCPGTYDKDEADLLIRITNTPTGSILNTYDAYASPVDADTDILSHTVGVSNNAVNIQTRVLLDWTQDIPGIYAITLIYTMQTTS
jgi:hypothetical protein